MHTYEIGDASSLSTIDISPSSAEYCFTLFGQNLDPEGFVNADNGQPYSGEFQSYTITLEEEVGKSPLIGGIWEEINFKNGTTAGNKITSVRLSQGLSEGQSIFFGLKVYNGLPVEIRSRDATSLTFDVAFAKEPESGFHYLPSVKVMTSSVCRNDGHGLHQVSFI